MSKAEFGAEDVIETLTKALVDRHGSDALAFAHAQAAHADDLPRTTWTAIIEKLREA